MLQRMELLISQPALHLKKPPVWHNSMRPHWKPCSALASEENLHLQDSFSVLVHVWLRPSIHPFSYFLILSKLIGHNYETVRFSAPYILFNPGSFFSLRNVWNPFPQIPPKPFFSPLLVYSYFTLDHTQLISLHLCVFKKKKGAIPVITGGLVLGRSHSEAAQELVHEWEKRRQRSAYAAASNKGSVLSLGKHSSRRQSLHFSLAPIGVCWAELLFRCPQWLTSGVHVATVSVKKR